MHNAIDASRLAARQRSLAQLDFSGSVLDDMPSRPFFPAAAASRRPRPLVACPFSPACAVHRVLPAARPHGAPDARGAHRAA
ncbi:hypothetical protein [Burkholderia glumae]|uniref:hypothetical protein n=1 Tax=Burkholderia glumae TaxID=337 RepID=UPI00159433CA|nr:hypothetical protein [Burkholderia glumae]NVE22139.1 hypothetical protein [Burkholderia glumae]